MPPKLLFDLSCVDLDATAIGLEEIQSINPQRHEFAQLTRVAYFSEREKTIVGVRDIEPDEFWTRGHMPGRPIFPGVLMIETAAQLCSIYCGKATGSRVLYGFGGADHVRFRKMVFPADRLVLIAVAENVSPRRSRSEVQGFVEGNIVFEASIFGIALPPLEEPGA